MSFTTWKIERYAFVDNAWSSTADTLTDFYDPVVNNKIGDTVDTFAFKIVNFNNTYDNYFSASDKIVISRAIDTTSLTSSDTLISGIVKSVPNEDSYNQDFIRVEGVNFSETLARALVFIDATGLTIPQFIQQALNHIAAYNDNFKVEWDSVNNPTLKTDGTTFPTVTEKWFNKSLLKLLEKYSSKLVTEDVNYYWYVSVDNKLVWKPREATVTSSFNSSTDDYKSIKTKKDTKDVYNFVIMKGGYSPGGQPIGTRVVNNISLAKHGFKPKIIISQHKYAENNMSLDLGGDANSRYPSSYPFTTKWVSSVTSTTAPACTIGSTISIGSDDEYDVAIVREAKYQLEVEANSFLDERGKGKLMTEIVFDAGKGWSIGDVINITMASIGKENNPMRVSDAQYNTDSDSYTLIEDEGTI